jgi:SAM-dependent MidA family methyltransferase
MLLPVMTPVEFIVRQQIQQSGPMSFAQFMNLALYCPELGFYERFPHRISSHGDFYTSVSVGPQFGQLLASQFARWLEPCNYSPCRIVEGGAHDGRLARDLLAWFQTYAPAIYEQLEYWLVEPSARRQQWQADTLAPFVPKLHWVDTLSAIRPNDMRGILFANELLDSFPVHRLGWSRKAEAWFEWGIDQQGPELIWIRLPQTPSTAALPLPDVPDSLRKQLPDGFTTEVSPDAVAWWRQAAMALGEGRLVTVDYGLRAEDFLDPGRAQGTVRAYHRHRLHSDLLAQPGEQDLTAHVNFTAIEQAGLDLGLQTELWTSQGRFLSGILARNLQDHVPGFMESVAQRRQFQTLTHPDHLGARYQVLIQRK